MNRINLNGKWNLKGISPQGEKTEFEGIVPGCTLDAVLASMPEFDVFYRDNAKAVQKYENYDWVYTRTFEIENVNNKYELVFDRLDTYCDVFVNEEHVAYCENGFIPYRFDVTNELKKGENTVKICFYSPVIRVKGKKERACAFSKDRLYTRRTQCTYGWDWTMRFVTCGIGDAFIEEVPNGIKVKKAYAYTKSVDADCAEIIADIDFEDYENGDIITVELLSDEGKTVCKHTRYTEEAFMRVSMDLLNPKLWYPNGYGKANLYTLVIKNDERVLYTTPFGIRTVKIMQIPDKKGSENCNKCLKIKESEFSKEYDANTDFSGFILKINGEKIMCKGANWVPCMPFAISDTKEKITRLLNLAKDAGVNMIRVWGGGAFESEHFYDECSRLGIMVTQDFLMACGDYLEDESWFLENLKKEAQYAVKLIRNKPCLVWWSGDNENAIKGNDVLKNYKGRSSAYKGIAPVVYKEDYNRVFLPSSPFGGNFYASNTLGTTHNTQFLGSLFSYIKNTDMADFKEKYKEFRARFICEEPVMGACSLPTLRKFMEEEDVFGDDMSMWLYHTKGNSALKTELFDYELTMAEKLLGKFENGKDRYFKLKYLQYEWMRISFEQVRREKWFSAGIIYWMLNDCWPASSGWAMLDYYSLPKASYYAFKRCAKPVVCSIDCNDGKYSFHICNDSKECTIKAKCFTLSKVIFEKEITIPSNTSIIAHIIKEASETLFFEITDEKEISDRAFFKHGKTEIVPCSDIEIVEKTEVYIKVKANKYLHVVELEGEAVFEDNYFSLMPNEEKTVSFEGKSDINVLAYTLK